ncbi:MAG: pimeloyl-ACP methyl ester carboxylesterase [Polyangiales bacterium]
MFSRRQQDIERRGQLAQSKPEPAYRQRIVATKNLKLHVTELGEGPPILLLHGFPEFWYGWHAIMPKLAAAGYRVIAPDLRGYNKSDKPESVDDYALDTLASDVPALLDALGLPSVALVGHDWGGAVAWTAAMNHPERVERLVVMNMPHPVRFAKAWLTLRQRIRSFYFYFFARRTFASSVFRAFGGLGQRLMLWWFSARTLGDDELDRYAEAALQPGAMRASMTYYTALLASNPEDAVRNATPLDIPTSVIWGAKDPAFDRELASPGEWAPGAKVYYIEEAGHFVHLEAPDEVAKLLLQELAGYSSK